MAWVSWGREWPCGLVPKFWDLMLELLELFSSSPRLNFRTVLDCVCCFCMLLLKKRITYWLCEKSC